MPQYKNRSANTSELATGNVAVAVPIVLPHVVTTVHEDGTMTITVDDAACGPEPPASERPVPGTAKLTLAALHGEGFVSGEDVAIAVIVSHADATGDGTVHGLLTRELLALSATCEVILFGRVSDTLTIGHPE